MGNRFDSFFSLGRQARFTIALMMLGAVVTALIGIMRFSGGMIDWQVESSWMLGGTLLLTVVALVHATSYWSFRKAFELLACAFVISIPAEALGTRVGLPHGASYHYHEAIGPRLFGTVPLFIPFAWFVLLYSPLLLLDLVQPCGRARLDPWIRIPFAALIIIASDLYLDPLAVESGAWTWGRTGSWFGVPFANFVGWGLVAILVYSAFFVLGAPPPTSSREARWLRWTNFSAGGILGGAALYCLGDRIEQGWVALAAGALLTLITLILWHFIGRIHQTHQSQQVES
ncbi:MAG: carotenoid biosynthesis protein [Verrucomicrobiota bacterium]